MCRLQERHFVAHIVGSCPLYDENMKCVDVKGLFIVGCHTG